ncbi:hypothetical protein NDA18_003681 [Ustilago nuda]|nr:hypothetical protein NDA18_003681 [Ustilago nuda]
MSSSILTKHNCSAPRRTSPTALRPLSAQLGTLARADASASFSFGPLNVVASVSGPTEVRIRDELTDRATLDVIFQPQHGVAGIASQAVSDSLFTAFSSVLLLHHYPRSLIQVVLQTLSCPTLPQSSAQVVHSDVQASERVVARQPLLLGPDKPPSVSELAALINAASLAQNSHLSEIGEAQLAGLLRQYKQENGETEDEPSRPRTRYTGDTVVLLDPTPVELDYALSTHVFAFSFSQALDDRDKKAAPTQVSEQILAQSEGAVDVQDLGRARQLAFKACSAVVGFMRTALHKRVVAQIG